MPFPSLGDLPNTGIKPSLPHCRQMLYRLSHQGSPPKVHIYALIHCIGIFLSVSRFIFVGTCMIKPFVTQFGEFPSYLEVYLVAQAVKHLPAMWETGFDPWVGKIPWRRKWQSTPVLLPGKYHCQRSLVGCSPWGHKESEIT